LLFGGCTAADLVVGGSSFSLDAQRILRLDSRRPMKPSELFGIAVRVVGLVSLLQLLAGAWVLFTSWSNLPWQAIARSIVWLFLCVYLLRGAPHIVRFAYPDRG
jgi:hypothetical protein